MKKIFILVFLSIVILSLNGCSLKKAGRFMGTVERSGCNTFGCR